MQWVTREHPKTDRIACPWLIRRFIDPHAEILYVAADQVLAVADRQQAISFDAPGARYTHRDGLCSFEVPCSLTLDLPAGSTVRDVLTAVRARTGGERLPPAPAMAVNERYAALGDAIRAGDAIAIIPPVAGG